VQWDDTENAGFTTGKPWFYVNSNYSTINVAQQEADPDSILNFYRKAIRLRKTLPVVRYGSYREHFAASGKIYCYSRQMPGQKILVLCAFSDQPVSLPMPKGFDLNTGKLILANYDKPCRKALRPYETRVYLWED
jgi:oligo-1,6-glucosidase